MKRGWACRELERHQLDVEEFFQQEEFLPRSSAKNATFR